MRLDETIGRGRCPINMHRSRLPILLAVCLVAGVAPFLAQAPPSSTAFSPVENSDSLRDYVQTLRGRLAVAGRELQIAERDLEAASAERIAGPDEVRGLAGNRDERLNSPWQDPSGSRAGVFGFQTRREGPSDGFTS